MNIMCIAAVFFACLGFIGLIMSIIGISEHNISLCHYATWFSSAASSFLIGLGSLILFNQVYIVYKYDYDEKINKPAENVYVNRCWTILGQEYCGKFYYETDNFKMDCDETGRCDIGLSVKE